MLDSLAEFLRHLDRNRRDQQAGKYQNQIRMCAKSQYELHRQTEHRLDQAYSKDLHFQNMAQLDPLAN